MRVAGEAIARQARIENGDLAAGTAELQGGGEAGKAAADDDDVIHGDGLRVVDRGGGGPWRRRLSAWVIGVDPVPANAAFRRERRLPALWCLETSRSVFTFAEAKCGGMSARWLCLTATGEPSSGTDHTHRQTRP